MQELNTLLQQPYAFSDGRFNETHPEIMHGFFTRIGGVSPSPYASLNCNIAGQDDPANLAENCARIINHFKPRTHLVMLKQTHSKMVHIIDETWIPPFSLDVEGDGLVTSRADVILGIRTADCLPVLFADTSSHVIGAAHAGWKGLHHGILQQTIDTMCMHGATRSSISAIIGPCIHQESYEVDEAFLDQFTLLTKHDTRYLKPSTKPGHYLCNLPAIAKDILSTHGIFCKHQIPLNTYVHEEKFFSFRRNTHQGLKTCGNQLSVIAQR